MFTKQYKLKFLRISYHIWSDCKFFITLSVDAVQLQSWLSLAKLQPIDFKLVSRKSFEKMLNERPKDITLWDSNNNLQP